jgi:inositol phosphorylceramide mannosyltransferase catalytic subunit
MLLFLFVLIGILFFTWYFYERKAEPFPKRIFQTWKNKSPPKKMAYWAETWRSNNPDYEYVLWDDADNRRFVAEKFKWFLSTYDSYDKEIKRADAIRYMYLYTYGGIYADLDFECLKSFDSLLEEYKSYDIILGQMESDLSQWHSSNNIPNAIMISKPGCNFWLRVLERMVVKASSGRQGRPEVETGPVVLKEVYSSSWFDKIKLLPSSVLYPISWVIDEEERLAALKSDEHTLTQTMKSKYPSSYAVTYWAHSW